jgi:hypothetical protein
MKVYIVTAYRFSNYEKHSYTVGVYSELEKAKEAAEKEEYFRGGKYGCIVYGFELDKNDMQQKIESYPTKFFENENIENTKRFLENRREMMNGDPDDWQ